MFAAGLVGVVGSGASWVAVGTLLRSMSAALRSSTAEDCRDSAEWTGFFTTFLRESSLSLDFGLAGVVPSDFGTVTDFVRGFRGPSAGLGCFEGGSAWTDFRDEYGSAVAGLINSGRRDRPDGRIGADDNEAP